jgi:hypothetical protein
MNVPVDQNKERFKAFPGSSFLEKTFCGSIDTTDPIEYEGINFASRLYKKAEIMCVSSPTGSDLGDDADWVDDTVNAHPSSALLARALVSEVTNNPKTMKPKQMADREYKLLKAQQQAALHRNSQGIIGAPGGIGPPAMLQSIAYACTGDEHSFHQQQQRYNNNASNTKPQSQPFPGRSVSTTHNETAQSYTGGAHSITIGLCMSRQSSHGHPHTVTRQTAYDFNDLQDRGYKYVSSTDAMGWRAGGGEPGGPVILPEDVSVFSNADTPVKEATVDTVHIPIIHINCSSEEAVNKVIHALASGDIFIPHMSVQPEALSVQGISPPDLVVRFGCERNDDLPPDEWPNWSLEFMHNQLYEYFMNVGAQWTMRPFSITLARKVRWKTVKHMNRYFAHSERVIDGWKGRGPQYLDPQLAFLEGGATTDEVAQPHGIYLLRDGIPTNYFCPNFEPPYTTKMTRSLLLNVLDKSWDKKRREWSSESIPKLVTPTMLMAAAFGCTDPAAGGFVASQVTNKRRVLQSRISTQIPPPQEPAKAVDDYELAGEEKKTDLPSAAEELLLMNSSSPTKLSRQHEQFIADGYHSDDADTAATSSHPSRTYASLSQSVQQHLPSKQQTDWDYDSGQAVKSAIADPPGKKVRYNMNLASDS